MKKFILFGVLLFAICCGVSAYAEDIGIELRQEKVDGSYLVTIDFDGSADIAVMSFEIRYNGDCFGLSELRGENIPDGAMLQMNEAYAKGTAKVSCMSLEPLSDPFGFAFLLTPKLENCETEVSLQKLRLADIDENVLTAASNGISVLHDSGSTEKTSARHSVGASGGIGKKEEVIDTAPLPDTAPESPQVRFADLQNFAWAEKQILYLAGKGIIKGTGENTFSPSANIKRGDFICLLVRMLGLTPTGGDNFADVDKNAYWYNEILAAKENGIALGSGGRFNPGDSITREDMFTLTARAMKYTGGDAADYRDYDEISDYAKDSINAMSRLGYIHGSDGRIDPKKCATRAETAVMLYNIHTGGKADD